MRRAGRILASLASVASLAGVAHADAPTAEQKRVASAHYKQAVAYYEAGTYEKAALEFRAAYDTVPTTAYLFNIARAYQLAGMKAIANTYYEKFLQEQSEGDLANEARRYRAEIAKALEQEEADKRRMTEAAQQSRRKEQADAHVKQARAHEAAGNGREAANEHVAAFEIDADPEHLFAAGEVARARVDDPEFARVLYARYLNVAPGGAHADAARTQIAMLAKRVDERAEADRRAANTFAQPQPQPQPPPVRYPFAPAPLTPMPGQPSTARVASMAANARTAAGNDQCSIANAIGDQIRELDPAFYPTVAADLTSCRVVEDPETGTTYGGAIELRAGYLHTGDAMDSKSYLGATFGIGGFLDLRPIEQLRIRLGARFQDFTVGYDGLGCAAGSECLQHLSLYTLGPTAIVEPLVYHEGTREVHLIVGGSIGIPLWSSESVTSTTGLKDQAFPGTTTQVGLDLGVGYRYRGLMLDLFAEIGTQEFSSELPLGDAWSISLAIGFTSLH